MFPVFERCLSNEIEVNKSFSSITKVFCRNICILEMLMSQNFNGLETHLPLTVSTDQQLANKSNS